MNCKPYVGATYGRLVVTFIEGLFAECQCACGRASFRCRVGNLRNGTTKSCGCLRREVGARCATHRLSGSREYKTWQGLRNRCMDPEDKSYQHYGGRGIYVSAEWATFEQFYADMGPKPDGMSIERRDNDGPYSAQNCYWATPTEQTRNRRIARRVTINGQTQSLKEWCDQFDVNYYTAHRRLYRDGWSIGNTFGIPEPLPLPEIVPAMLDREVEHG